MVGALMMRFAWISLVVVGVAGLSGCGARSSLDDASGEGGADASTRATSNTASTNASATSSSTGVTPACPSFEVSATLGLIGVPGAVDPELARKADGNIALGYFEPGRQALLLGLDWSLDVAEGVVIGDGDIDEIALGPGPLGPIVLTHDTNLLTRIGTSEALSEPLSFGTAPHLFVAGAGKRVLLATGGGETMQVGSYLPGSGGFIQTEAPFTCVAFPLASAVPSGDGFLAVVGRANPPDDACFAQPRLPATVLSVIRYDEPAEQGAPLLTTIGHQLVSAEAFIHGKIAPASFGAWIVYQTDGSTSLVMPPIQATRVGPDAQVEDPVNPLPPIVVSREGLPPGPVAVATMGDALAVAYSDRSGETPQIVVQRIERDGSRSATVNVPTSEATYRGNGQLRLLASQDGTELAVAWEGGGDQQRIGVAVLGCTGAR